MEKKQLYQDLSALVFDIDGTLVNNIAYHERSWISFCEKHDLKMTGPKFRRIYFGKNNEDILQSLFRKRLSVKEIQSYADEKESLYRKIYRPHIQPIRGLADLIKKARAKGLKIAIASAAPKKNREFVLRHLGLQTKFDLVVGEEDIRNGKPHPEIYLKVSERLHLHPQRCLVFEDSPSGVKSAKQAGMKVVGILTGYSVRALGLADTAIKDFTAAKI